MLKYLFLFFVFAACKKENRLDCFKSNGNSVLETRSTEEFTSVKVFDKIDLNIVQGTVYKVEVAGYSHTIKNISTIVKNGQLSISNKNTCNFVRGYKKNVTVSITVPGLVKVENLGVGTIKFNNDFRADHMKVVAESSGDIYVNGTFKNLSTYANGNGDIYLSGSSDSLNVFMNGTNFLYGNDFTAFDYALAETHSMGDCFFNAATVRKFDYAIYRSGNIYYRGNPSRINNLNSENTVGKLVRKD